MLTLLLLGLCGVLVGGGLAATNPEETYYHPWESECGQSLYPDAGQGQFDRYIVGGIEARENEFPWQVSLKWMEDHVCGGVVIDKQTVVTAAHCTDGYPVNQFYVTVGDHILNEGNAYKREIALESYEEHPNWDDASFEGDICLLTLAETLEYNDGVQPICRPVTGQDYADTTCTVSGWGATDAGGSIYPLELRYTNLPVISQEECYTHIRPDWILDDMVCAMDGEDGDRDSCYGDSGGPLAYDRNGRFELVGLVSWGFGCTAGAGVYTRVSYYADWIDEQLAISRQQLMDEEAGLR